MANALRASGAPAAGESQPAHLDIEKLGPYQRGDASARARRHAMLLDQMKARDEIIRRFQPSPPADPSHRQPHAQHERELQTAGTPQRPPPPQSPPSPPTPPEPPPSPPPAVFSEEMSVLTELYVAMGGATWRNRNNWLVGYPCELPVWQGVICSLGPPGAMDKGMAPSPPPGEPWQNHGRVQRLLLWNNRLNGTLPAALGKL